MGSENRSTASKRWKTQYGFDVRDSDVLAEASRLLRHLSDDMEARVLAIAKKWASEGR
jgi:hypothetical protein